jgi:uncharacterized protein (TIGR02147 family)
MTTYRDILKSEFETRKIKNQFYSIRAFARDLEIPASHLSRILRGQKNLSSDRAEVIAPKIFKQKGKQRLFIETVRSESAKSQKVRNHSEKILSTNMTLTEPTNITDEKIFFLKNWYMVAILELSHLVKTLDIPTVCLKLGIDKDQAQTAIDRLLKLGLLQFSNHKLIATETKFVSTTDIPSEAIRSFHKEMITQAIVALDEKPITERYITGQTVPIAKKDLQAFKDLILQFQKDISQLAKTSTADDVYQMNMQFFSLTKGNQK